MEAYMDGIFPGTDVGVWLKRRDTRNHWPPRGDSEANYGDKTL